MLQAQRGALSLDDDIRKHIPDLPEFDETITVRKVSFGVGVERIFPLHAPIVQQFEVIRKGKVRRAKLYYLRDRVGKATRIKEKRD